MKRKAVLTLTVLMLILGVCIMLYPTVSTLVNDRSQSQVIIGYQEVVARYSEEELAALRTAAQEYNERLRSSSIVLTDPFSEEAAEVVSEGYYELLNVDGDGVMGYIDIPSINVHLSVYHGTSQTVLAKGVGHLEGTSLPVGGAGSHSVLSAHTGLSRKLFDDLTKLEEGDTFTVTVLDEVLTYEVYDVDIVEPTNVSSLSIQAGEDLCTLVTCTPRGINTHRLLVHGTRVETPAADGGEETPAQPPVTLPDAFTFPREYLLIGGGVAFVALVLLILAIGRKRRRRRRVRELWRQIRES